MNTDLELVQGPTCPRCGCNDCTILRHPSPGRWFGGGRAQCRSCGITFPVQRVEVQAPVVEHAAPIIDGERTDDDRPAPVRYQILCCPACGSERTKVFTTKRPVRHHKCRDCGHTFKTIEERQRPPLATNE